MTKYTVTVTYGGPSPRAWVPWPDLAVLLRRNVRKRRDAANLLARRLAWEILDTLSIRDTQRAWDIMRAIEGTTLRRGYCYHWDVGHYRIEVRA